VTAVALDRGDLARWFASAAVALAVHAGLATALMISRTPVEGDDGTAVVMVELAPIDSNAAAPSQDDIAPGPLQQEAAPTVEAQPEKPPEKTDDKVEPPPPAPEPEVVLPQETPKPEVKPQEAPMPAAPLTTAPPRPRPSAAQVATWHRTILLQLERHKGYPAAARERHETGVARLAFSIDRSGRVVTSRIVQSSGSSALDQETLATVRRAQPFPNPPLDMPGETFDFTVPIRFNIK